MIDFLKLPRAEVGQLLRAEGDRQQDLFRQARRVRSECCGDEVLLRGVLEISNFCQNRCSYCAMRSCNQAVERFRLPASEILEIAAEVKRQGIGVVSLQSGQDPLCDETIEEVIPAIRREMGMDALLCVGERPREVYERFVELGATSFILNFETSDPRLYEEIVHGTPGRRLLCMEWIQQSGMKLGTGNIVGLPGQTVESLVEDVYLALTIRPDFVSCVPFIPNQGTPFEGFPCGDLPTTLNTMAVLRILLRTPLVPSVSALEKLQVDGQLMGLNAGANVIAINFTPEERHRKYMIYSKQRFVVSMGHALRTIERAGLRARPAEFQAAREQRRGTSRTTNTPVP